MQTHLDDQFRTLTEIASDLDALAASLDHRHRQQRKIQFLLDIRGYYAMNQVAGNYVEFGLYRGEMLYSAHRILGHLDALKTFIGLDNFAGEPSMSPSEMAMLPFLAEGDYKANEEETRAFLASHISPHRLQIIVGDFRDAEVAQQIPSAPIALGVIDCNLPSSIDAALDAVFARTANGAALFMDDFYLNIAEAGVWHESALASALDRHNKRAIYFQTYAPCAQAILVFDRA